MAVELGRRSGTSGFTFRTAADLCEEFDGFIFNHNESILYEWVEEHEPELFARIQNVLSSLRVVEGGSLKARLYNSTGEFQEATLHLPDRAKKVITLNPWKITTIHI